MGLPLARHALTTRRAAFELLAGSKVIRKFVVVSVGWPLACQIVAFFELLVPCVLGGLALRFPTIGVCEVPVVLLKAQML